MYTIVLINDADEIVSLIILISNETTRHACLSLVFHASILKRFSPEFVVESKPKDSVRNGFNSCVLNLYLPDNGPSKWLRTYSGGVSAWPRRDPQVSTVPSAARKVSLFTEPGRYRRRRPAVYPLQETLVRPDGPPSEPFEPSRNFSPVIQQARPFDPALPSSST